MFCRWCGSEIPNDAELCPHCGEILKSEDEIIHKKGRKVLEREVTKDLTNFFNNHKESAFSTKAIRNRLEEIITDSKTREFGSEHLYEILKQMKLKGALNSSIRNNETHYHISDAHQEKPNKTIYSNEKQKKPTIKVLKKEDKSPIEPSNKKQKKLRVLDRTPPQKKKSGDAIAAYIISGIIGGISFLAGIILILNIFTSAQSTVTDIIAGIIAGSLAPGLTLVIIGIIILGITTKGFCCDPCDPCCREREERAREKRARRFYTKRE